MAQKPGGDQANKDQADDGRQESIVSPVSSASQVSPVSPTAPPRRWSQFAEHQSCPLPELAVDPEGAPEPLQNLDQPQEECANRGDESASTSSAHPVVEPDFSDQRSAAMVYVEPDRSWVSRHKSYIIAGLVVAVIILTGVTVGVVVTERQKDSGGGSNAT